MCKQRRRHSAIAIAIVLVLCACSQDASLEDGKRLGRQVKSLQVQPPVTEELYISISFGSPTVGDTPQPLLTFQNKSDEEFFVALPGWGAIECFHDPCVVGDLERWNEKLEKWEKLAVYDNVSRCIPLRGKGDRPQVLKMYPRDQRTLNLVRYSFWRRMNFVFEKPGRHRYIGRYYNGEALESRCFNPDKSYLDFLNQAVRGEWPLLTEFEVHPKPQPLTSPMIPEQLK